MSWWEGLMRKNGNARNFYVLYSSSRAFYKPEQNPWNRLLCQGCHVLKIDFTNWNAKIALSRAGMAVTYCTKLLRTTTGRHNGILMSLLLLVAEATRDAFAAAKLFVRSSSFWVNLLVWWATFPWSGKQQFLLLNILLAGCFPNEYE